MRINFSDNLLAAINRAWQAVGPDVLSYGEDVDNEDAVEACSSTDMVRSYGNDPAAVNELSDLYSDHGYEAVQYALAAKLTLV